MWRKNVLLNLSGSPLLRAGILPRCDAPVGLPPQLLDRFSEWRAGAAVARTFARHHPPLSGMRRLAFRLVKQVSSSMHFGMQTSQLIDEARCAARGLPCRIEPRFFSSSCLPESLTHAECAPQTRALQFLQMLAVPLPPTVGRMLDVGAGAGVTTRHLAAHFSSADVTESR